MNPDLYTDEYRNFKFLKSSPVDVSYFKTARGAADLIQPWDQDVNPNFHWKTRLEFIEQLLDLRHDSVYIVFAGLISSTNIYEDAKLITLEKPIVLNGNPIVHNQFREVTYEDIPHMNFLELTFTLIEEKYMRDGMFDPNGRIFNVKSLPVIPFAKTEFTELFYDKGEAEEYKFALTDMLRKKLNTISTFASRL
jgi:hypothetical protein